MSTEKKEPDEITGQPGSIKHAAIKLEVPRGSLTPEIVEQLHSRLLKKLAEDASRGAFAIAAFSRDGFSKNGFSKDSFSRSNG